MKQGTVFWLTGLSGSGKTTIGRALTDTLRYQGHSVIYLDGDELREVTNNLFGHDRHERLQASLLYARLCKMLASQFTHVVCATISLFHETQQWNREHITHYLEIFIDVPISELIKRDPKKIYARAAEGKLKNIVGMDIEAEYPKKPDIHIKNYGNIDVLNAVEIITDFYQKMIYTHPLTIQGEEK